MREKIGLESNARLNRGERFGVGHIIHDYARVCTSAQWFESVFGGRSAKKTGEQTPGLYMDVPQLDRLSNMAEFPD